MKEIILYIVIIAIGFKVHSAFIVIVCICIGFTRILYKISESKIIEDKEKKEKVDGYNTKPI